MQIVAQPDPIYSWLHADSLIVAPKLLGWILSTNRHGIETSGRIIEVEAYRGSKDPASHAFRGPTTRTRPMYQSAGHLYVYLSYGIHTCLNIVTGPEGTPQAVLIRALEPLTGLDAMLSRRHTTNPKLLASGPGRLTQALSVTLADSGAVLGEDIALHPPTNAINSARIIARPRIGISVAKDLPWRFQLI